MGEGPEYLDSIGRLVGFASRSIGALTGQLLAEHGLTVPQWIVLSALWREDGLTVSQLAAYSKSTKPATSRLLGRMEEEGLVQRRSPPDDRRTVRVWLTDDARALSDLLGIYEQVNERVFEGFSAADRRRTRRLLQRVIDNATRHHEAMSAEDPLVL